MAKKLKITDALLGRGPRFQGAVSDMKDRRQNAKDHAAGNCACHGKKGRS